MADVEREAQRLEAKASELRREAIRIEASDFGFGSKWMTVAALRDAAKELDAAANRLRESKKP